MWRIPTVLLIMFVDYHLLFAIYCWVLTDGYLQGIEEQIGELAIGNGSDFYAFLERIIGNFEFKKGIYKIWFKLLIAFLNTNNINGLNHKHSSLIRILNFIHKMTLTEVLNYLRENRILNDFFVNYLKYLNGWLITQMTI